MGNNSSKPNPFNPYSHRIDVLKRELRDKTNQDEQLHSDMFGKNNHGGFDDHGTPIYPIILTDLSEMLYPGTTDPVNPDNNLKNNTKDESYYATLGLQELQRLITADINTNRSKYETAVKGYYDLQQDIFGKSRDDPTDHNVRKDDEKPSLIKQITDLSGDILIAEKRKAYLNMTELTGSQFSFEAVKEQNNSLQNQINENTATYSKDESKIEYQIQQNTSMKIFNSVLLIIYGICLLVLAVVLFGINQRFSFVTKVAIVIVFMLFPFCFLILQQLTESIRSFIHRNYPNSNVYLAST